MARNRSRWRVLRGDGGSVPDIGTASAPLQTGGRGLHLIA